MTTEHTNNSFKVHHRNRDKR